MQLDSPADFLENTTSVAQIVKENAGSFTVI